jgi:hypothetical protein
MTRGPLVLVALAACGGGRAPATAPPAIAETETETDAAVDAPPPLPPVARIEGVIVAGPHTADAISALLAPRLPTLAACLSGDGVARATEILVMVSGDTTELTLVWQGGALVDPEPACLTEHLGGEEAITLSWDTKFSTAYLVVRSAPSGVEPPPAPSPPDRKADVKLMFCDLFDVSGAMDAPIETRSQIAIDYAHAHIRHPAAYHIAQRVSQWNPAELKHNMVRALEAEGIKRCALQRF